MGVLQYGNCPTHFPILQRPPSAPSRRICIQARTYGLKSHIERYFGAISWFAIWNFSRQVVVLHLSASGLDYSCLKVLHTKYPFGLQLTVIYLKITLFVYSDDVHPLCS